jgi:hypothetical protein
LNIDWEFAGYFSSCFELTLWRAVDWAEEQEIYNKANTRELEFFGLKPEDLEDCIPPP